MALSHQTKEAELVSVCAVCMPWVSYTAWKGLAEESQGQFLAPSLSPPSQCWETLFRKSTAWRWDHHGSTKPTEIQQQACFSSRQTTTWELTDEYVGILETLLECAYQSGLLKSTWLEAPSSTAPLPLVNCCQCYSPGESSSHAPAPGIKCWGGKVEMEFPLTHSCSLRVRGRPSPLWAGSQQSQLLRFHPFGSTTGWSKHCILCHTET